MVLSSGGVVTGKLEVTELDIFKTSSWHIGSETNRIDLIIDHPDGCINTLIGDLNLAAEAGHRIIAQNFLQLEASEQCGIRTITPGNNSVSITNGLSSNTVISITPMQCTEYKYWVEVENGEGIIYIDDNLSTGNLSFYYIIIRK